MKTIMVFRRKVFFRQMELATETDELTKGLLGRNHAGSGLFLYGATAIHTFGMRFPIDAVYVNENGLVIGWEEGLLPNREGMRLVGVSHIVEFNPGTIKKFRIRIGEPWSWLIDDGSIQYT